MAAWRIRRRSIVLDGLKAREGRGDLDEDVGPTHEARGREASRSRAHSASWAKLRRHFQAHEAVAALRRHVGQGRKGPRRPGCRRRRRRSASSCGRQALLGERPQRRVVVVGGADKPLLEDAVVGLEVTLGQAVVLLIKRANRPISIKPRG